MFLLIIVLMGLNFNALLIPPLALAILTIFISAFQIASLVGYGYWAIKSWDSTAKGTRLKKILYFGLLILVTVWTTDLAIRMFVPAMGTPS
jgi:hypothetical protein